MNARVLKTLEYDKITEALSAHATSDPGRKMCGSLLPCADLSDAMRALQETADASERLSVKGRISFGALKAFEGERASLAIGGTLDPASLLRLASFFENVKRVREYGVRDREEEAPDTLHDYFHALSPLEHETAEIRRIVLSEEEISSDASTALKQIRRQLSQTSEKVREVLNKMVNGETRNYLQDAVITMRGDRYCLPVRAEHKQQVKGIVHDRSSSGSTLFIEPATVVDLNNRLRELALQEEKEIARILSELSALCADHLTEIDDNVTYMSLLDFIFAKAAYGQQLDAVRPVFSGTAAFSLKAARHPLIAKDKVVPTDIFLSDEAHDPFKMLIITGPNTGGKTVTLKTTGLLTLMGMSGLMIPAEEGSGVAFYKEIYADIGDEQSIEQSLSTFSAHMTQIVHILDEADEESLCLLDELGAGTDPTEGAALAIAILNDLLQKNASVLATTHYAELKVFAMTTAGVKNASCEFDVTTLRPTYRLLIGTPGASNAFAIAKRLGLSDDVIEGAHAQIDTDKARMETLFQDLEESRKEVEKERAQADKVRAEQEALTARLKEQEEAFDTLGDDILSDAHKQAEEVLAEAKRFADETIRLMRKAGADPDALAEAERSRTRLNEELGKVRGKTQKESGKNTSKGAGLKESDLVIGERVRIVSSGLTGTVKTLPGKDGKLTVTCGVMQVETNLGDLVIEEEKVYTGKEIAKRFSMKRAFAEKSDASGTGGKSKGGMKNASAYVAAEINLIGKNTDDALAALDKYLDDAYLTHLPSVRIVHGKGTGTLRSAVQKHLKDVRYVKSFKSGAYGEGDAGVTVVTFKG